jgi:hypothetical protein
MSENGTVITLHAPVDLFIEGRKAERKAVIKLLTEHAMCCVDGDEQERVWTLIQIITRGAYEPPRLDG